MPEREDTAKTTESEWTVEHHLVGTDVSLDALVAPTGLNVPQTTTGIVAFQQEDRRQRRPALWRSLITAEISSSGGNEEVTMAMDRVAADGQQATEVQPVPSSHNVQKVQERLVQIYIDHITTNMLPQLVFTAAWEHVLHQYLQQQAAAASAGAGKTTGIHFDVPQFYRQTPGQYLVAPVAGEPESSGAAATYTITPSQLLSRIKTGLGLVWQYAQSQHPSFVIQQVETAANRRSSSRIATLQQQQQTDELPSTFAWKVLAGGKVATYVMEQCLDVLDDNGDTAEDIDATNAAVVEISQVPAEAAPADKEDVAMAASTEDKEDVAMAASAEVTDKIGDDHKGDVEGNGSDNEQKEPAETGASGIEAAQAEDVPLSPESVEDDEETKQDGGDEDDYDPGEQEDDEEDEQEEDDEGDYVKENLQDLEVDMEEPDEEEEEVEDEDCEEEDEEIEVVDESNPYLKPQGLDILEWLGRKTAKFLSLSELQAIFPWFVLPPKKKKKKKASVPADLGISAEDLLSPLDRRLYSKIMSLSCSFPLQPTSRLVLAVAAPDETVGNTSVDQWETAYFGRTPFTLQALDQQLDEQESLRVAQLLAEAEQAYKEQKAWDTWRYKGIHGGYTVWPNWLDTVEAWCKENASGTSAVPVASVSAATAKATATATEPSKEADADLALAQALADQDDSAARPSSRRTTRRGGEVGVFYGSQSGMTQKQLMDAVLRIVSTQSFQIITKLLALVPDDSSDPVRRARTVLGKLVWKRNQLAHLPVQTEWSDGPVWKTLANEPLLRLEDQTTNGSKDTKRDDEDLLVNYMRSLHQTELQLRNLVMQHLTDIPVAIIATAADERPGTMESMDDADFEDPSSVNWLTSGHDLLNKFIFRPAQMQNTDDLTICQWYRVQDFSVSVVGEAEPVDNPASAERSEIGNAKEAPAVERRMRCRVVPSAGPGFVEGAVENAAGEVLILTEAQAQAGLKAGEIEQKLNTASKTLQENPFAGGNAAKITLFPPGSVDVSAQINGIVVGHDTLTEHDGQVRHRILLLPESTSAKPDAIWVSLHFADDGTIHCHLPGESTVYTAQQFDYHSSSPAFRECLAIVNYLQRHPKAIPFLEPVDPVALNVPEYFNVVKHPMDISTLAQKLENGHYSNIPSSQTIGRNPVTRMLNGPFRRDVELIFDNAMLFNPPNDWIHQAAAAIKKSVLKKIEQVSSQAEVKFQSPSSRQRKSVYVDDDSDVDIYVYESEGDDDYDGAERKRRKRKRQGRTPIKEDSAARAVERPIRLQNVLSESMGLRGHLANLPIQSDASTFSLPPEWSCRRKMRQGKEPTAAEKEKAKEDKELDELIALYQQAEANEAHNLRRTTRHHAYDEAIDENDRSLAGDLEYFVPDAKMSNDDGDARPNNRQEVELVREKLHETLFAKLYYEKANSLVGKSDDDLTGRFADGSFPPYLGRVVPLQFPAEGTATWEIRSPYVVPALRWVIRGLVHSGHLSQVEEMTTDNLNSGVILANHVYYWDSSLEPFEILDQKEMQRRKRANQEGAAEESEEEIELSEYEKLRAARVARNAERLRALGLA